MPSSKALPAKSSKKRPLGEDEPTSTILGKPSHKRRVTRAATSSDHADVVDLTGEETNVITTKKTKAPRGKGHEDNASERRIRPFRKHPPKSYLDRLARATSQRCDKR
ncbi:hypothetical protein PHISCL_04126 [Aspergillus sclerotialis]|uniref:Uncharacterized protein n=1 Tax=Aspergillus sclerotialis TaxID=2070753 RepID=A0A3A2ZK71_9EURO|nr:hypothetical protein PHISCL_04126 [Aspergillus sclerotialis]